MSIGFGTNSLAPRNSGLFGVPLPHRDGEDYDGDVFARVTFEDIEAGQHGDIQIECDQRRLEVKLGKGSSGLAGHRARW